MERRWKVLIVTSVAVFMGFLDVTIVNVAFPDIEASFSDTSRADLSWVLNAYNIVFAALLVPAGRLADQFGRKRFFFVGTAIFVVASAASGLAPSVEVLIGARVLQAVGAAILVPTSLALLLPEFPPEKRATATAIWGATGAVAAATGPSLGGLLVEWVDWRLVFFVNVPIGLAALIPARALLHETRMEGGRALPDVPGAALLVAGVGALALGIVKGQEWGWGGGRVLASFAVAAVAVVLLVLRSRRHASPVVDLELFRTRSFSVAVLGVSLFAMGFYALLLANVLFTTQVWGWSILTAGFALTPGPLTAAIFSPIGGRLSDRFGQRVVAVPGGVLFALGCLGLAATTGAEAHYATDMLPWMFVTGAGVGLSFAAWSSASVAELPPARFATGSAISVCMRQIGAVLGIAILIAVLDTATPATAVDVAHDAWRLMALAALAAAATGLALGRVRAGDPSAAKAPPAAVAVERA
jgi:EmrB/QacA subfamily drug resistance transporter